MILTPTLFKMSERGIATARLDDATISHPQQASTEEDLLDSPILNANPKTSVALKS